MERPSDGNAALPAASGAAVPRWKALLATGIRRLAVWGTGLLAALVALLALAQIVCLALCLLALVVLALCFLMASYPEECRPLRKGKEPAGGCGQKKTTRRRVVFFRIRERGRAYSLGWSSSGRLAVSCWPCSRLR